MLPRHPPRLGDGCRLRPERRGWRPARPGIAWTESGREPLLLSSNPRPFHVIDRTLRDLVPPHGRARRGFRRELRWSDGTFEVCGAPELAARYATHGAYVQAVAAAADAALGAGWILASDPDAYVATAQASLIGTGQPLTPAQVLACFDL